MTNERLSRLKAKAVDETGKLLRIFLYFWVVLTLFSLHKALVFNEDALTYQQGFALINAFALAKVVLVAQSFHLGEGHEERPPVYAIVLNAAIFSILLLIFHVVEETAIGVWRGNSVVDSIPKIGDGTLQAILIIEVILFFALIPFFFYLEIERAIGAEQLHAFLFGPRPPVDGGETPPPPRQSGDEFEP